MPFSDPHAKDSLHDRLSQHVTSLSAEAERLPPGAKRDAVLRRAREFEVACHLDRWISSGAEKA